jgi:glycosyltransferase involved in cell wall biosynthesis
VPKVSFIIPAFNEGSTIAELIGRVDALPFEKQLVIVDDGSTDGTAAILEELSAGRADMHVVRQANRGKGAAIRAAIPHLTGEITVIQDADLEYDPTDVPQLIEPLERGVADVVFGSRLRGGRPQRAYLFWHLVGNRVPQSARERALQHHPVRHRDRVQSVSHGDPHLPRPSRGQLRDRARDHGEGMRAEAPHL